MPCKDEQPLVGIRTLGSLRRGVRSVVFNWARELRRNPAPGEMRLWDRLRAKQLGFRFHYQSVLRGWIADFWCPAKRLVVEVDGWSHRYDAKRIQDCNRDEKLRDRLGIVTLRFPVERMYSELDAVVADIRNAVASRPTSYIYCGNAQFARRLSEAKIQLENPMDNYSRIEMPDFLHSDKAVDEALRLYRETRGEVPSVRTMDEFRELDRQFPEIEEALEKELERVKASRRSLHERLNEIKASEKDSAKSKLGTAMIRLSQEVEYHCRNHHRLEVKRRDDGSGFFWGCPEYPRCMAKGRSLTSAEEARLEQLVAQ